MATTQHSSVRSLRSVHPRRQGARSANERSAELHWCWPLNFTAAALITRCRFLLSVQPSCFDWRGVWLPGQKPTARGKMLGATTTPEGPEQLQNLTHLPTVLIFKKAGNDFAAIFRGSRRGRCQNLLKSKCSSTILPLAFFGATRRRFEPR
jgi:hypothetical protein